jgi:hypothetical protein
VRDVVNGNQGNLESIAGGIQSQLPGLAGKAFGDNPLLDSGNAYAQDVLGGKYLNSNPYLDAMVNRTNSDVGDQVNSLFARSGASLGTAHAGTLGKSLADSENNLRYTNYAQERQNQQNAASMIPSLSSAQYAGVAPYLAAAQSAGTLPYAGLSSLSPIIGLAGGSGQQRPARSRAAGATACSALLNAAASGSAETPHGVRRTTEDQSRPHWRWAAIPMDSANMSGTGSPTRPAKKRPASLPIRGQGTSPRCLRPELPWRWI